ncbi:methanethiol S-methyltransferase [Terrarubrum flagellatum]|uniref:methanethiol S-methyltransferase n=1 Tax=Terrirubrum flagellatum TaxID=2895980 RepID=UPI0031455FA0
MSRIFKAGFGLLSYLLFLVVFLYAVGFLGSIVVPKAINDGASGDPWLATAIDVLLLTLFAVQHSVMARPGFKRWWTKLVPTSIERSVYVLFASLLLVLLFWQWRPIGVELWRFSGAWASVMIILFWSGWAIALISTFLISHFELFGVRQVLADWLGGSPISSLKTPLFYRWVRHPLYLGFIISFWSTPVMTVGHLLFAGLSTAYIFVGIHFEERDLLDHFGDAYASYKERVRMLLPVPKSRSTRDTPTPSAPPAV